MKTDYGYQRFSSSFHTNRKVVGVWSENFFKLTVTARCAYWPYSVIVASQVHAEKLTEKIIDRYKRYDSESIDVRLWAGSRTPINPCYSVKKLFKLIANSPMIRANSRSYSQQPFDANNENLHAAC